MLRCDISDICDISHPYPTFGRFCRFCRDPMSSFRGPPHFGAAAVGFNHLARRQRPALEQFECSPYAFGRLVALEQVPNIGSCQPRIACQIEPPCDLVGDTIAKAGTEDELARGVAVLPDRE